MSNCWKPQEFDQFIDDFNPDIVFGTLPDGPLISNLMLYVKKRKNIPLITYPWDDYYSLRHTNISPIFWIRKVMQRHYLSKTAKQSDFLYVISNLMKEIIKISIATAIQSSFIFQEKGIPKKLLTKITFALVKVFMFNLRDLNLKHRAK